MEVSNYVAVFNGLYYIDSDPDVRMAWPPKARINAPMAITIAKNWVDVPSIMLNHG